MERLSLFLGNSIGSPGFDSVFNSDFDLLLIYNCIEMLLYHR